MFDVIKIHGHEVLAWVKTEEQSTGPCGYVLVQIVRDATSPLEWVTAWYRSGDNEWNGGHYFNNQRMAWQDFFTRARRFNREA